MSESEACRHGEAGSVGEVAGVQLLVHCRGHAERHMKPAGASWLTTCHSTRAVWHCSLEAQRAPGENRHRCTAAAAPVAAQQQAATHSLPAPSVWPPPLLLGCLHGEETRGSDASEAPNTDAPLAATRLQQPLTSLRRGSAHPRHAWTSRACVYAAVLRMSGGDQKRQGRKAQRASIPGNDGAGRRFAATGVPQTAQKWKSASRAFFAQKNVRGDRGQTSSNRVGSNASS